jgi:hypothetical protein
MERPQIYEWYKPNFDLSFTIFYLFSFLCLLAVLGKYRNLLNIEYIILIFISMYFSFKHQRHIPFFLFTTAVFIGPFINRLLEDSSNWFKLRSDRVFKSTAFILSIGAILGILSLLHFISNVDRFKLKYDAYPVQAINWLNQNHIKGNLLLHFNEASYALLKGYPNLKVAIDGRYEEVYTSDTFNIAVEALNPNGNNFINSFHKINPDIVILCKSSASSLVESYLENIWHKVYTEDSHNCSVFMKEVKQASTLNLSEDEILNKIWEITFR